MSSVSSSMAETRKKQSKRDEVSTSLLRWGFLCMPGVLRAFASVVHTRVFSTRLAAFFHISWLSPSVHHRLMMAFSRRECADCACSPGYP